MSAKSRLDPNIMLPIISSSNRKSLLFNFIGLLLDRNDRVFGFLSQGFSMIIGNGFNAEFWSND